MLKSLRAWRNYNKRTFSSQYVSTWIFFTFHLWQTSTSDLRNCQSIVWKGKTTLSHAAINSKHRNCELGWVKNYFLKLHIAWEYKRPHEFPLTKLSEDHSLIGGEHSLIVEAPFWNTLALESPIFRFVYSEEILRTLSCQGWLNKCPCHSVSDLWIE